MAQPPATTHNATTDTGIEACKWCTASLEHAWLGAAAAAAAATYAAAAADAAADRTLLQQQLQFMN